jgi:ABC-type branched-subunit amino acid transport system ATPase component
VPPPEAAPLLDVQGVSKSFGGVHAVIDCSFTVAAHAIVGLIGPNGAGKSTAIEVVSGFQRPDSGTIRFAESEIQGKPSHEVSRLGLIRTFQLAREWPHMTVAENLLVAAPARGRESVWKALFARRSLAREEADDLALAGRILDQLGLTRLADEYAGNLSGGQKRLVEFGRILMARPRMVLLDEPLAGVNPVLASRIGDAIRGLRDEGITVLMVEHNLPLVESTCDVVIVMAIGRQIAEGTMADLRNNSEVVDAYLGSVAVSA